MRVVVVDVDAEDVFELSAVCDQEPVEAPPAYPTLGFLDASYPRHAWVVASFFLVGVMAVIAIGILEPANLAVLFELRKPEPNGALIGRLMRRFIYTAGITGLMQVGTLIIMTRLAS